uniref:Uncharacterized protein n=1 Tax=Lepeophtheirus salmonis TaxID=72036 RepID=A0A0K2TAV9_LEPSM
MIRQLCDVLYVHDIITLKKHKKIYMYVLTNCPSKAMLNAIYR